MARHDVHRSPRGPGYLLDVQADVLDGLATRVVAPLVPGGARPLPVKGLNPVFEIEGVSLVMVTQALVAVPASVLRAPVASLSARSNEISRALDMLFSGF